MKRYGVARSFPSASTISHILTVVAQVLQQAKRIEQIKRYASIELGFTAKRGDNKTNSDWLLNMMRRMLARKARTPFIFDGKEETPCFPYDIHTYLIPQTFLQVRRYRDDRHVLYHWRKHA